MIIYELKAANGETLEFVGTKAASIVRRRVLMRQGRSSDVLVNKYIVVTKADFLRLLNKVGGDT